MISAELESNPHTSWNRVGKCMLGKVLKFGVWGRWDEVETFDNITFANAFLLYWPFLKGIVDGLPYQRRMSFSKTVMRGTSARVLQKLVDDFKLLDNNYPINMIVNKPVLLISEHLDDTEDESVVKKGVKDFQKSMIESQQKNTIKLKRKGGGPYTRVRHQYGVGEEDGNVGSLF